MAKYKTRANRKGRGRSKTRRQRGGFIAFFKNLFNKSTTTTPNSTNTNVADDVSTAAPAAPAAQTGPAAPAAQTGTAAPPVNQGGGSRKKSKKLHYRRHRK